MFQPCPTHIHHFLANLAYILGILYGVPGTVLVMFVHPSFYLNIH